MNPFYRFFGALAQDLSDNLRAGRWAYILSAVVLAATAANIAYFRWHGPQQYHEFVVGTLAWQNAAKTRDYVMLFVFVAGFITALPIFARLSSVLTRRAGMPAQEPFHSLVAMALLPASIWFFGLLLTRNDELALLDLSCMLLVAIMAITALLTLRGMPFWNDAHAPRIGVIIGNSVLVLCVAALTGVGFAMATSQLGVVWGLGEWAGGQSLPLFSIAAAVCAGSAAVIAYITLSSTPEILEAKLLRMIVLGQLLIPGLFFILLPTPWVVDGARVFGAPVTTAAWAVVGVLIVLAYADLHRCAKAVGRGEPSSGMIAVSPVCLIAVILLVKVVPAGFGAVSDDYHFGEFIVPWWSWAQHGLTPFWDYAPVRGFVNYLPGALNAVLFDGTAATMRTVGPFRIALILLLAFPALAYAIGKGPAFLALLMAPAADGLREIDILAAAALCLLCESFLRWRPTWSIIAWIMLGTAMVLVAPGQGGLFVLATTPLGMVLLRRAWRTERRSLIRATGLLVLVFAVLALATPFGLMLIGAVRYGIEHSASNVIANGRAWSESFGMTPGPNPWLWEIARASWLAVTLVAGVLVMRAASLEPAARERALVYGVPILLLTLLFVMRAATRLDPGMSRAGLASIWSLSLLLPLLLLAAQRPKRWSEVLFVWVSAAAVLAPLFGARPWERLLVRSAEVITPPHDLVVGARVGLPNLGTVAAGPDHLSRLVTVRGALDRLLEPGETYLDLTNRNAHYFYFDRPPPIDTTAFYNLYHTSGQLRAIHALQRRPPPAVLAEADNLLHDGGPAGFRAYLLYRHVLLNYLPAVIDDHIWLVRPDRAARLGRAARLPENGSEEDFAMLDRAFRSIDLRQLPIAWGRSYASLQASMRTVAKVTSESVEATNSRTPESEVRLRVSGASPHVVYDIESLRLAGRDAGLLSFAFECAGRRAPVVMRVYWTTRSMPDFNDSMMLWFNAAKGRLIVPLDAAPRWLLAKELTKLRIEVPDPASCASIALADISLSQRRAVDMMEKR